jgi:hypothetical protein
MRKKILIAFGVACITIFFWFIVIDKYFNSAHNATALVKAKEEASAAGKLTATAFVEDASTHNNKDWFDLNLNNSSFKFNSMTGFVFKNFSVDALIKSYNEAKSIDEKKGILLSISRLYRHLKEHEDNHKIRAFFKNILNNSDHPDLAVLAALLYGRLEIHDDTVDVLYLARSKGFLTDDELYSEIALIISEESIFRQTRALDLLRKVMSNNNELARIRLISEASSPVFLQNASDAMRNELFDYVLKNKTTFNSDYSVSGISMLVNYEQWMLAYTKLSSIQNGNEGDSNFINYLSKNKIEDHREALIIFQTPFFGNLSTSPMGLEIKSKIEEMVGEYSFSYPNNPLVQRIDPEVLNPLVERHKKRMAKILRGG